LDPLSGATSFCNEHARDEWRERAARRRAGMQHAGRRERGGGGGRSKGSQEGYQSCG
jgi:hypothetical protein